MADHESAHASIDPLSSGNATVTNPFQLMKYPLWVFFLTLLVGGIGFALVAGTIERSIGYESGTSGFTGLMLLFGIQTSMLVFAWRTTLHAGINIRQLMGTELLRYNWVNGLGWATVLLLFTFSSMATLGYVMVSLFSESMANIMVQIFDQSTKQQNPLWVDGGMAILGIIIAPTVEEFVFRGLFLHYWSTRRSVQIGLCLTALLFAILHLQNFVGMFIFSLVMALLYIRTRTLWVPIGVHAAYNAIIFGPALLGRMASDVSKSSASTGTPSTPEGMIEETIATMSDPRFGASALILLVIAGFFIIRFLYRNWPQSLTALPYFQNHQALR